jgi:hypothetical protein
MVSLRILLLLESETYMEEVVSSMAMSYGCLNSATVPVPSVAPALAAFPARENTNPDGVIPRMRLLFKSATTHKIAVEEPPPPGVMPPPPELCGRIAIPVG